MRPVRTVAGLFASALLIAACSSSSTAAPAATQAPVAPAASAAAPAASVAGVTSQGGSTATIQNFSFQPASLTVSVGTTVTWTNKDSTHHTVTADDGSFDSKALATGATFSQTFTKAGTYAYHCAIHPSMKATIVVQ